MNSEDDKLRGMRDCSKGNTPKKGQSEEYYTGYATQDMHKLNERVRRENDRRWFREVGIG